jgi:2-acylglycerol O-acyltransferase 2
MSIVMSSPLNAGPSDPLGRNQHRLPSPFTKTYADAVDDDDDPFTTEPLPHINEDLIKETPPRPIHARNISEPRSLGEIIDGTDPLPSPGSPTLRHPRGKIGPKVSSFIKEGGYAEAVKQHALVADGLPNGDGNGMPGKLNLHNDIRGEAGKERPAVEASNGSNENKTIKGESVNGNGVNGQESVNGQEKQADRNEGAPDRNGHNSTATTQATKRVNSTTETTFDGIGEDAAPKSPTKRAHKRGSSRSLNFSTMGSKAGATRGLETPGKMAQDSEVLYDHVRNKSGEDLASIKPGDGYYLSLQQRADKPPGRPSAGPRRDSELTSGRRAGEGWGKSAMRWAPLNVPLQRRLQTLVVLLHTLSIAGSVAIFFLLCGVPLLWPILVPYLLYCLFSRASVDGKLSQRSEWMRSSKAWSLFASYFPARLHRSQQLEPTRKYVFGYHPHGIISHGAFAAFATEALGFSQLFPGITNTLLTLDSNFRLPLYREYALRMGLASVSRESCENILSRGGPNGEGMGRAITIVVGGARESLDAKPHTLRLVLQRRKGFVKLAIRTGADLVPVLAFGENDIYDQFDSDGHPWIHKGQMLVKKLMGFTVSEAVSDASATVTDRPRRFRCSTLEASSTMMSA